MVKNYVKSGFKYLTVGAIGAIIGRGMAYLGKEIAESNIAVRPELAHVGFKDALFSGHPYTWLMHNHEEGTTAAITIGMAAITMLNYWIYKDRTKKTI